MNTLIDSVLNRSLKIRKLEPSELVPYELLLLADPSKDAIDSYLHTSDVYVIENGKDIIAVYVLYPLDKGTVEIKYIAVHVNYQGQGLGKYMLTHACGVAKASDFKRIKISTANSSLAQLYLYQRQGFEITGLIKDFFTRNYPESIYENGILAEHMVILSKEL